MAFSTHQFDGFGKKEVSCTYRGIHGIHIETIINLSHELKLMRNSPRNSLHRSLEEVRTQTWKNESFRRIICSPMVVYFLSVFFETLEKPLSF